MVVWTINTVTAPGDNIEAEALVLTYSTQAAWSDTSSTDAENDARIRYDDAAASEQTIEDTATATVVEPDLALSKTIATLNSSVSGGQVTRGDTIDYLLTLSNNGAAPAYRLIVTDTAPAGLRGNTVAINEVRNDGALITDWTADTSTFAASGLITITLEDSQSLAAGDDLTVAINLVVANTANPVIA